jgi:hypothetical protein
MMTNQETQMMVETITLDRIEPSDTRGKSVTSYRTIYIPPQVPGNGSPQNRTQ